MACDSDCGHATNGAAMSIAGSMEKIENRICVGGAGVRYLLSCDSNVQLL